MNEEGLYSVTMTEEELRLFSEFIEEQKEFAAVHPKIASRTPAHQADRNALARKVKAMRRSSTPAAITSQKREAMTKSGYPKHYVEAVAKQTNTRPTTGPNAGTSLNERLSASANRSNLEYLKKEKDLIANKHRKIYTPDKTK